MSPDLFERERSFEAPLEPWINIDDEDRTGRGLPKVLSVSPCDLFVTLLEPSCRWGSGAGFQTRKAVPAAIVPQPVPRLRNGNCLRAFSG
jgi:hypothetical protein